MHQIGKSAATLFCSFLFAAHFAVFELRSQTYGEPDLGKPGDKMIQSYLAKEALQLEQTFLPDIKSAEDWEKQHPVLHSQLMEMLGLSPLPERTPLNATVTRTLDRGDYVVEMLHFQSRPGLYVTANLYRPSKIDSGTKLPAVLYLCGHSHRPRNGNKTAFQSHGIWLARHGYVCLILDTLQLGEIPGIHHGTYNEQRWWWLSRGYTPAGVECWNGIRAIDYLLTRSEVDPERLGVTGISGGGASTFWVAAADPRIRVAVPVSGMGDLTSYLPNRVINGHCDCMFLYNTYQWNWTTIAALIAPRPHLFVNSDLDPIFPMDANERVINRLERLYSVFGAGDRVDAFVSIGGHDYRKDIRQGVFRFLNTYLKNDPTPIEDSEVDLVTDSRPEDHPIPPEQLRVFPTDADLPRDSINARVDETFVPLAQVAPPSPDNFQAWRAELVKKLRRMSFHHFPEQIPAAKIDPASTSNPKGDLVWLQTEPGISVRLQGGAPAETKGVVLQIRNEPLEATKGSGENAFYQLEPRGIGATEWTRKNPPNFVERSHYLLGRTVDSGRVWDIAATVGYLRQQHPGTPLTLVADGPAAVLAACAALLGPNVDELKLENVPPTLMASNAPVLLNFLRVCDVPELLQMVQVPTGKSR